MTLPGLTHWEETAQVFMLTTVAVDGAAGTSSYIERTLAFAALKKGESNQCR